jgi:hypothetical protein
MKRSIRQYDSSRGVNQQFLKTSKDYSKKKIVMNFILFLSIKMLAVKKPRKL